MSALNKDSYKSIKRFFKDDDALSLLCAKIIYEAFGKNDSYALSIGKSIKAGMKESEPDFIIDAGEYGYYINLRSIHHLLEFHPSNRETIIERAREYGEKFKEEVRKSIVFVDCEIDPVKGKILDLGAVKEDDSTFHENNSLRFKEYVSGNRIVCGHNVLEHDLQYLKYFFDDGVLVADTLLLSALLFPQRAHHNLEKDDKLRSFEKNNPMFDAEKARTLFYKEVIAYNELDEELKRILYLLLKSHKGFQGFFEYIGYSTEGNVIDIIKHRFENEVCNHADLVYLSEKTSIELAYVLSVIAAEDNSAIFAPWVLYSYPKVDDTIKALRNTPCGRDDCKYCNSVFNARKKLKQYFGFDEFRIFEGRPLQEKSVEDAVQGKSFITVFPTGGGKSLTFQLPALIAGETEHALTVVISPLQALMKDQVDNLENKWMIDAVMINGLLDPVARKEALERIRDGTANLLYISPEALRNNTISKLIKSRVVARFVIDEAHCFSAWGQDFRVDYLYIGKFIRELQKEKQLSYQIPVSCFTATAGKKVLEDIQIYFHEKLGLEMDFILASPERKNLRYLTRTVKGEEKCAVVRDLINDYSCPTIVYVSKVADTYKISNRLIDYGIEALPFNGPMPSTEKQICQKAFLNNDVKVMVATSAFGMGVDKDDIGLIIHYQAPASLEEYLQEAGRAGRNGKINGVCVTLFDEDDINFNFFILNQTKLSFKDIQNVWRAIKIESHGRTVFCVSTKELADAAGWTDNDDRDTATEIKTAIGALENAGYVERKNNLYRIHATGIMPDSMIDTSAMISQSGIMDEQEQADAKRIMSTLFTSEAIGKTQKTEGKPIDEIADALGLEPRRVLHIIGLLKEEGILADSQDMTAVIYSDDTERKSSNKLNKSLQMEEFLINRVFRWEDETIDYKQINEKARDYDLGHVTPIQIRTILMHWGIREYVRLKRIHSNTVLEIKYIEDRKIVETAFRKRRELSQFIIRYLYELLGIKKKDSAQEVKFSLLELRAAYENQIIIHEGELKASTEEIQDALMYIQRIGALKIEGGFFVLSQKMKIRRLEMNNQIKYKKEDYKDLQNHYAQKGRQIHIMAEYAKLLGKDSGKAKEFVNDYFAIEPVAFDRKYFSREQIQAMKKNISPEQYQRMFGYLSNVQKTIINDGDSQYITVAAGPGSGKTMVLVHKLASLVLLEDVKCEQLLMLTFSRMAATEFKKRLIDLIGTPAYYVEIKTFHSYCFDILGRKGNIDESVNIEKEAVAMMQNDEIEKERINKAVLVVDEAQDMSRDESNLINTMISLNDDMRVILVGDDDQNIFEFRGSSSEYMRQFINHYHAACYNMPDNYRSDRSIVTFANELAKSISGRIKTEPGRSVRETEGSVLLAKYRSQNLEIPVLQMIKQSNTFKDTCILTRTNKEAFMIMGALLDAGISARLIQNVDGFYLSYLVEIRRFLDIINEGTSTPVIPDDLWTYARDTICNEYADSVVLETCLSIIDGFETVNSDKYKTDLEDYLTESQFEDFIKNKDDEIIVSTIHKAKGREYSNVYLVLNNSVIRTDEDRRLLYVGCTRAKNNLIILYNNDLMDPLRNDATRFFQNRESFGKPNRTISHLSHKGVYLDFFINRQDYIRKVRSGDKLTIRGKELWTVIENQERLVGKLSSAGFSDVNRLVSSGFNSVYAEVRFVVHWTKQETSKEYLIILPTLVAERIEKRI